MSFLWKPGRIVAFCCLLGFVFGGTACDKSESDSTGSRSRKRSSSSGGGLFSSFTSKSRSSSSEAGNSGKNPIESVSSGQKNTAHKTVKSAQNGNDVISKTVAAEGVPSVPGRKFGKVVVPPRKIGPPGRKINDLPKPESGSTVNNRRLRF